MKSLSAQWGTDPDVPAAMAKVAEKRVGDFVLFYGRFIETISLRQLAMSCYLQGCRDMAEVAVRGIATPEPPNPHTYEI